jgi:preprotein translocase subunit SecG
MGLVIIGLLTFVMVLDCLLLILLVLIQLPKKEAGAGLAFGGVATDALFGAGAGNVLTKVTKYAAGIFFGLALLIGIIQSHSGNSADKFMQNLSQPGRAPANAFPPPSGTPPVTGTNTLPILEAPTNAPDMPRVTNLVVPTTPTNAPPPK